MFKKINLNNSDRNLPSKFTYPFYYQPHPIAISAAEELMEFLEKDAEACGWEFGLKEAESEQSRGRMFGILVVKNQKNELGFLAAYSGNTSIPDKGYNFVPPVNDFWDEEGFYILGIKEFDKIGDEINSLENNEDYQSHIKKLASEKKFFEEQCNEYEIKLQKSKEIRDEIRAQNVSNPELLTKLSEQSKTEHIALKKFKKSYREKIYALETEIKIFSEKIDELKSTRKILSKSLQERIYEGFQFLNIFGEKKNLSEIFQNTALKQPPSGAGECAAPRLLQFAFSNGYQPVAMAEFWWGINSKSELRKHKHFYPACRGKCEPILGHMLKGIELETPEFYSSLPDNNQIEFVYEDDYLFIVNKPAGLLSVPGKITTDSIFQRLNKYFKNTDIKPLLVHRLDMDTSGLLLVAKQPEIYKQLQALFANRKVKKTYVAVLDGVVTGNSGTIDLKLTSDYLNRPRQMVDQIIGKTAITHWEAIEKSTKFSLVHFYPITGRTHQLRVHAAHEDGLNCPILGDDLYGKKADRLYLHAERIEFQHPVSKKSISFTLKSDFEAKLL